MSKANYKYNIKKDYSILFADIKGFSELTPYQQKIFPNEVLGRISPILYSNDYNVEQANTWGDGIVAFFSSYTSAVRCALALRDVFRTTQWHESGLPNLKIRISLNSGEVFEVYDPIRKIKTYTGVEINRAARLEPIVLPNHVYATKFFVARCTDPNIKFLPLGKIPLPKGWGEEEIFVVGRAEHENLDANEFNQELIKSIAAKSTLVEAPFSNAFHTITQETLAPIPSISITAFTSTLFYHIIQDKETKIDSLKLLIFVDETAPTCANIEFSQEKMVDNWRKLHEIGQIKNLVIKRIKMNSNFYLCLVGEEKGLIGLLWPNPNLEDIKAKNAVVLSNEYDPLLIACLHNWFDSMWQCADPIFSS